MDDAPYIFQVYAERAAGLGCTCGCCEALAQWLEEPRLYSDWFHGDPRFDAKDSEPHHRELRRMLRRALNAVGDPACFLGSVLERCEACEGECYGCGVELPVTSWEAGTACPADSFCGEALAVLGEVVESLCDRVCAK